MLTRLRLDSKWYSVQWYFYVCISASGVDMRSPSLLLHVLLISVDSYIYFCHKNVSLWWCLAHFKRALLLKWYNSATHMQADTRVHICCCGLFTNIKNYYKPSPIISQMSNKTSSPWHRFVNSCSSPKGLFNKFKISIINRLPRVQRWPCHQTYCTAWLHSYFSCHK